MGGAGSTSKNPRGVQLPCLSHQRGPPGFGKETRATVSETGCPHSKGLGRKTQSSASTGQPQETDRGLQVSARDSREKHVSEARHPPSPRGQPLGHEGWNQETSTPLLVGQKQLPLPTWHPGSKRQKGPSQVAWPAPGGFQNTLRTGPVSPERARLPPLERTARPGGERQRHARRYTLYLGLYLHSQNLGDRE